MKHLLSLICLLVFFFGVINAQKNTTKSNTAKAMTAMPDTIPLKPTKADSGFRNIPEAVPAKKTDNAVALNNANPCNCVGTSFDTCCPVKKICCETKIDKVPGTITLQKNFASAEPFSYKYFVLNGKKQNICIRICNINRISYDINANGEIIKTTLPDFSLFDSLASTYKSAINTASPDADKQKKTPLTALAVTKDCNLPINGKVTANKLEEIIKCKKEQINNLSDALSSGLKQLDRFARFAKDLPIIIGSECCSQQNIKNRIGNQADIKAFDASITYENISERLNNDVPTLLEDVKKISKAINAKKGEIEKIVAKYKESDCKPGQQDSVKIGKGKKARTFYSPKELPAICNQLPDLIQLDNAEELQNNLAIAAKANIDDITKSLTIINNLLAKVNNDGNFFYTKCFEKDDAEFVNITFKATAKDAYKPQLDSQIYKYTVPVKGRFKWAIGPSLNFHFGGTLVNSSYSLDSARRGNLSTGDILKDTFNISLNSKQSHVVPYIGVMAHFYWQQHMALTPAITIGISTSPTQLSELRAYLGGSVIIGGPIKGKLIFSSGLSGGAVDRLKPNLIEGANAKNRIIFNGNNLPSPDQLVEKVFRIGFFFGMTYNLKD